MYIEIYRDVTLFRRNFMYTFFYKNVIFSTKASKEREIYKITMMFLIFHESKPLRFYTRGSYIKKKCKYGMVRRGTVVRGSWG